MQEATTLVSFLTELGGGVPLVLGWVVEAANTIVESPFLLMTVVFLVVGGSVAIMGRLLRRG